MNIIENFLHEFENIIFKEHLTFIRDFKNDYKNFNVDLACSHDNSSGDVVDTCECYFFYLKKQKVMKIIDKYKSLIQHFSSRGANHKVDKKKE